MAPAGSAPQTLPPLALLGPQRTSPVVAAAARRMGLLENGRRLALISAGWEEREPEDGELSEHLGRPVLNLELWSRTERVFAQDPELFAALRGRHDRMRRLRRLYRARLDHMAAALREVLFPSTVGPEDEFRVLEILDRGEDPLLYEVAAEALQDVQRLDQLHLRRVADLQREFEERWRPGERLAMAREREAVLAALAQCSGVLVAGGHVAVLLNRLRLFRLSPVLAAMPVIAWSAGAMALTERIVLFHDSPPQGSGLPEVFEPGLGLADQVVAFPDAGRRLQLGDGVRSAGLARRLAPARCLLLDAGEVALRDGQGRWSAPRLLRDDGSVSTA